MPENTASTSQGKLPPLRIRFYEPFCGEAESTWVSCIEKDPIKYKSTIPS